VYLHSGEVGVASRKSLATSAINMYAKRYQKT
jgi:hypothetical protein